MAMTRDIKVNLTNSRVLKISTDSGKSYVRLVLDKDGIHGHYTDIHVDNGETFMLMSHFVNEMGIQLGESKSSSPVPDISGILGTVLGL